jgi:hypothetical protein
MSEEIKSDSVLMGWTDPQKQDEDGSCKSWRVKFKAAELKDMLENYVTTTNKEGHGGNVYVTLFVSKSGKSCCRVWDPNSEGAKEQRDKAASKKASLADDLPF